MKYILFLCLTTQAFATDISSFLQPLMKMMQGQGGQQRQRSNYDVNPRDYMGQEYIDRARISSQTYQNPSRSKLEKLLSLYPNATLFIQRKEGERMPPAVILLLQR